MQVLVADDDPVASKVLTATLQRWGYEVVTASNGSEALQILTTADPPRLAILDWVMPGIVGPDICSEVRRTPGPYVYMLLLTANTDPAEVVAGMNAGADDYIKKPFNPEELQARLRAGTRIVELQEELRIRATRDPLTGLLNRRAILERLEAELERASRQGSPLCAGMVDVDRFKRINDTYGHTAGDAVLREIASRMQSRLRAYDMIGRYGGEEFTVVIPYNDLDGSVYIADRIRAFVAATPIAIGSEEITVTVSIGLADAAGVNDVETLLRHADSALFKAKNGGRNRVEVQPVNGIGGPKSSQASQ